MSHPEFSGWLMSFLGVKMEPPQIPEGESMFIAGREMLGKNPEGISCGRGAFPHDYLFLPCLHQARQKKLL